MSPAKPACDFPSRMHPSMILRPTFDRRCRTSSFGEPRIAHERYERVMDHNSSDMEEFIVAAVARTCNLKRSALTLQSRNFDIGMDCLAVMTVMSHVQSTLGVQFGPKDTRELFAAMTLNEFIVAIQSIAARHATERSSMGAP